MVDVTSVESIVFSRLLNKYGSQLSAKFPNINFTTSDREPVSPAFPTVYVHELSSSEVGATLDGIDISGINSNIQIEVVDNKTADNVRYVFKVLLKGMKELGYNIVSMPVSQNTQSIYKQIARFNRVYGNGDVI